MSDPTIKSKILREAGRRREKRLRIALTQDEYAILLSQSIKEDIPMADIIRKKVFKDV